MNYTYNAEKNKQLSKLTCTATAKTRPLVYEYVLTQKLQCYNSLNVTDDWEIHKVAMCIVLANNNNNYIDTWLN